MLIDVDKAAYIQYLGGDTNVDEKKLGIGKTVLSPLLEAIRTAMVYKPAVATKPQVIPIMDFDLGGSLFAENSSTVIEPDLNHSIVSQ